MSTLSHKKGIKIRLCIQLEAINDRNKLNSKDRKLPSISIVPFTLFSILVHHATPSF